MKATHIKDNFVCNVAGFVVMNNEVVAVVVKDNGEFGVELIRNLIVNQDGSNKEQKHGTEQPVRVAGPADTVSVPGANGPTSPGPKSKKGKA